MRADCPKCGSTNARYEKTKHDLILACLCGFHRVVFSVLNGIEIEHNEPASEVRLPRRGTHLYNTLICLWSIEPANSKEVTDTLVFQGYEFTVSDVSSYLMMLRSRGLVRVLDYKRGVPGGSTWECTEIAVGMMEGD